MQESQNIFLPGGSKLFRVLRSKFQFTDKRALVIGAGCEKLAQKMIDAGAESVKMIVNDFESLMNAKLNIQGENQIEIKLMEYDTTDFDENKFDLVYAQGSISSSNRNKIVKEVKRILKYGGILCVGEITSLTKTYPPFMKDIFEESDILPLYHEVVTKYYEERGFEVVYHQDISSSLKSFYENASNTLKQNIDALSGHEKSYYKKILKKMSHESNAYLKLGADKYIGFDLLILKLNSSAV